MPNENLEKNCNKKGKGMVPTGRGMWANSPDAIGSPAWAMGKFPPDDGACMSGIQGVSSIPKRKEGLFNENEGLLQA